ncbi:MAG: CpsB/CapC family capsule biosynthesis tyrosine phosphatase [Rikenellaceae bacterium]
MLNIFSRKKSLIKTDFFNDFTDFHSHILPSVDDGVKSLESAISILDYYESIGIKRVVFTPHIMENFSDNCSDYLKSEFKKFTHNFSGNIELSLAAEYMLDSGFYHHLESGKILTVWDNYILIETSYLLPPINLFDAIKDIKSKGYFIVLAHPERYGYMREDDLLLLKQEGVLFQLNLLSLTNYYGEMVQKRAIFLLENDMYNIIGSDIHNLEIFKRWIEQVCLKPKHIKILQKLKKNNICVE